MFTSFLVLSLVLSKTKQNQNKQTAKKKYERCSGQQNASWKRQNSSVIPSVNVRKYHTQINRDDHQAVGNEP